MSLLSIKEDTDAYIKDITSITCLILEESNQYRFIHRTVQEYYSASFIRTRPEPIAIKFYQACHHPSKAFRWDQELSFLSDIDKYRHNKYFLLPVCSMRMGYQQEVPPTFLHPSEISPDRIKNILGAWILGIRYNGRPYLFSIDSKIPLVFYDYPVGHLLSVLEAIDFTEVIANIVTGKIIPKPKGRTFRPSPRPAKGKFTSISINEILDADLLTSEFRSLAQQLSLHAYETWHQATSYINKQDAFIKTVEVI
jgi:hypothetical protein